MSHSSLIRPSRCVRHSAPPSFRGACIVTVLVLLGIAPSAAPAAALEGAWRQLGVPIRLDSPLLWDEGGHRLVALGADAFGAADSIEDAWEFRAASGWRRIRLPQPPAGGAFSSQGLVADPRGRRFLALRTDPAGPGDVRLWSLEIAPVPGWKLMDPDAGVPSGGLILEPRGESVWLRARFRSDGSSDLWMRSLADTGRWRLVRALPASGIAFGLWRSDQWIDSPSGRLFELLSFDSGASPIPRTWIQQIATEGAGGWSAVCDVPAVAFRAIPDTARGRQLLLESSGYSLVETTISSVWEFSPADSPCVRQLAQVEGEFRWASLGLSRDTLWVHGTGGVAGQAGARMLALPLADPAIVHTAWSPRWPPFPSKPGESPFFHDPTGRRWLYVPLSSAVGVVTWPDSLWELTIQGDDPTWRVLPIAGGRPGRANQRAWANDESGRRLYVMNSWNDGTPEDDPLPELFELRYDDAPRWNAVEVPGPAPLLRTLPAVCFVPASRKLTCFGYASNEAGGPDTNLVWTLTVDTPADGWRSEPADGRPPLPPDGASAIHDPLHDRIVFRSLGPAFGALELLPRLRWVRSSLEGCPLGIGADCIPGVYHDRAMYDPVGARALLLGGDNSWLMRFEDALSAVELGDTLGPVHGMRVLGSPGGQNVAMAGYDGARDALIVFGNGSTPGPSLYEFVFERRSTVVVMSGVVVAHEDHLAVRWTAAPGSSFLLWRHDPGGGWRSLGPMSASASGTLLYEDHAIEAGESYGYRLTSPVQPYTTATATVWATAPVAASALSLSRPWPNPARGSLNVAFTTVETSPIALELFDVAGRRVWSRRWDAPVPGPHYVVLDRAELPRAALYFLRLRQAGLTAMRRVVFVP